MTSNPPSDGDLDELLSYIHERRGFDFRGYKRGSLSRRIYKRMQTVGAEDYQTYKDILEANPGEFGELFNTILINVTALLRDRDAWEYLATAILPNIVTAKDPADPIRVWSAGCASGEEVYSLAVLLAEAVGEERFRSRVKVYATDADVDALVTARHGRYPLKDLLGAFGPQRTERFFEEDQGFGVFRPDLRRSLIFGRHDLVKDPPISKIDLLVCRNTLMYFTADVQRDVLSSFHFALNQGGFLFLGKSETLVARTNLFEAIELRRHVFRKDGTRGDTFNVIPPVGSRNAAQFWVGEGSLPEALLEQSPIPQLVVDAEATVLLANRQARRLLSIGSADLGYPLKYVGPTFRSADLSLLAQQALHDRRTVTATDVASSPRPDDATSYDIVLVPLDDQRGVAVSFLDITRYRTLRDDLERSQRELESAYEELQSAVEELETTNEELQSTNEELETTNEELHSTNEELETMNEELQSTNEELEAVNNEFRDRSAEVDELNIFLASILASLGSAVVVLDTDMEIRAWNRQAEEMWGLRTEEVHGQHFLNLDIGFPVESLGSAIRACFAGRSEGDQVTRQAVNRRGRLVDCTVRITRLVANEEVRGVILLMDAVVQQEDGRRDVTQAVQPRD